MSKRLKLKDPADIRNLIKKWLADVIETGNLPFEKGVGGVVVQMLQTWLKSYEMEKLEDVEKRLSELERDKERSK